MYLRSRTRSIFNDQAFSSLDYKIGSIRANHSIQNQKHKKGEVKIFLKPLSLKVADNLNILDF